MVVSFCSRNLPEVRSAHEVLGIPTVSARFGTSPFFWNWGMEAMTKLLPLVHVDTHIPVLKFNVIANRDQTIKITRCRRLYETEAKSKS